MEKTILRQPKIYSPPKEQKTFALPKYVKIIILIIVVLIGLGYLAFFSPVFKIKYIQFVGSPSEETKNYLEEFKGYNIFLLNSDLVSSKLKEQNPTFLSVDVFHGIPSTLRVRFIERQPKIIWQTGGKKYLIDENGIAYAETVNVTDLPLVLDVKNLPLVTPTQIASESFVNFVKEVKFKLSGTQLEIKEFQINETIFQVDGLTNNNLKIIFDTTRSISDQIDAATKVYLDHTNDVKQYLDVRVEGRVYYQ